MTEFGISGAALAIIAGHWERLAVEDRAGPPGRDSKTTALKPCPFCRKTESVSARTHNGRPSYAVTCMPGAGGCGGSTGLYPTEADARVVWNGVGEATTPGASEAFRKCADTLRHLLAINAGARCCHKPRVEGMGCPDGRNCPYD
jgi:hypothetical protein